MQLTNVAVEKIFSDIMHSTRFAYNSAYKVLINNLGI